MADGVELEGFEDLTELFKDLEITEQEERAALNTIGNMAKDSVDDNIPKKSEEMKKSVKKTIKRTDDGDLGVEVKITKFYAPFQEYGTSQQKHNVGFFDRSINNIIDKAIEEAKKLIK